MKLTDGALVIVPASRRNRPPIADPKFRFVDLFAGIGGIRAGLEHADGQCVYTVEKDPDAIATYEANWGPVDVLDIADVEPIHLPTHEILAAGFPCQPFSLAGVSRKNYLKRAHGFKDATSGNLFFQILKLIGGDCQEQIGEDETRDMTDLEEATAFQATRPQWDSAPPVLLLENVLHLIAHDSRRTFRVIRRRLMKSGYWVSYEKINGAVWVPQNRRRTIIVCLRADMFPNGEFKFNSPGDEHGGPRLRTILEPTVAAVEDYRLTSGTWEALKTHLARHTDRGTGFGYSIADPDGVARTLSARYYKDGAEILIDMRDGGRPRRLTPTECARLMGFTSKHLGFDFVNHPVDSKAYKQFGNSVVVPQFNWIADEILERAGKVFAERMAEAAEEKSKAVARELSIAANVA